MKLSIAVGILSSHSVIAEVLSEKLRSSDTSSFSLRNALSEGAPTRFRGGEGGLQSSRLGPVRIDWKKKNPSSRALEDEKLVDCNPNATAEAGTADVGVLGCGDEQVVNGWVLLRCPWFCL